MRWVFVLSVVGCLDHVASESSVFSALKGSVQFTDGGRLTSGGSGPSGVHVFARSISGLSFSAVSDANGRFELRGLPGCSLFNVSIGASDTAAWGVTPVGALPAQTPCGSASGSDVRFRASRTPVGGRVLGLTAQGDAQPIAGVTVTVLHPSLTGGSSRVVTDAFGRYLTPEGVPLGDVAAASVLPADAAAAGIAAFTPASRAPPSLLRWLLAGGSSEVDTASVSGRALQQPEGLSARLPDIVASRYALCAVVDDAGLSPAHAAFALYSRTFRLFSYSASPPSLPVAAGAASVAVALPAAAAEAAMVARTFLGNVLRYVYEACEVGCPRRPLPPTHHRPRVSYASLSQ
jgi:hypothetical protein